MKQAKRLTREQKEILSSHYMKADDWAFVSESDFYLKVINKSTGVIKMVDKCRRKV